MRLLLNICSILIQKKSLLHAEPSLIRLLVCFTVWLTWASSESNMGEIIGFWMPTMTLQLRDAVLNIMIAFVRSPSRGLGPDLRSVLSAIVVSRFPRIHIQVFVVLNGSFQTPFAD